MYKKIFINEFRQFHNVEIHLGQYITVLAGRNSTGKSTILGLLGNSSELKKTICETYTQNRFRAEFCEIIKGSNQFDKTGNDKFRIIAKENDREITCTFRTAWQRYDKDDETPNRFRLIPKWTRIDGITTESKLDRPVLYLGLSRLFPIGEANTIGVKKPRMSFDSDEHEKWFVENYQQILSINDDIRIITNYSISETDKKIGTGITTDKYDYLTNSSGQDNLGQILLSLLSFKRVRQKLGDDWKGGLLLIDEIDATLHPVAQDRLFDLLCKEAKSIGFQVVITTHSLSLLHHVAEKIKNNTNSPNQNIELYYFQTSNRKLELRRNPAFFSMENELMIQSTISNNTRIKIYSEDAETRWMLRSLIGNYASFVEILDICIGCQSLMSMYKSDPEYFTNVLIVLDGDVKKSTLDTLPETIRNRYNNIVLLPGEKCRPEQLIYEYIMSCDETHEVWNRFQSFDMTWQYFKEHGPESAQYKKYGKKDRENYKKWFIDHMSAFDTVHLGEYWIRDNKKIAVEFLNRFIQSYNTVARRTMAPLIHVESPQIDD